MYHISFRENERFEGKTWASGFSYFSKGQQQELTCTDFSHSEEGAKRAWSHKSENQNEMIDQYSFIDKDSNVLLSGLDGQ